MPTLIWEQDVGGYIPAKGGQALRPDQLHQILTPSSYLWVSKKSDAITRHFTLKIVHEKAGANKENAGCACHP